MNETKPTQQNTPSVTDRPPKPIEDYGTASLVCSLVSLIVPFVGLILAGVAIYYGKKTRDSYDDAWSQGFVPTKMKNGDFSSRGMATAGFIIGIISLSLGILWIIFYAAGIDLQTTE